VMESQFIITLPIGDAGRYDLFHGRNRV